MTQCLGKDKIDLTNVDLASFSGHKIYCFRGIGCLYKKKDIVIDPLIHGGRSTTVYRSGTPQTELIVSLSKAIRLIMERIDDNYKYIKGLNGRVRESLSKYKNVVINSTDKSIPHILNFSILGIKPETFLHALEEHDIFISTKSACAKGGEASTSVLTLTKDEKRAESSLRISLSYKTTNEEIDEFLKCFDICYNNLNWE
jgi:cysteine desulfurase